MKYRTHVVGGILASLMGVLAIQSLGVSLSPEHQGILIATSTFGSLVPDIDHQNSYIGTRARLTSKVVNSLCGHRGVTHSPMVVSTFMFLAYCLFAEFVAKGAVVDYAFLGLLIGMLSHMFLDMLTKGGIPLWYPFTKKKVSLTGMKTGSIYESFFLGLMVLSCFALVVVKQ